MGLRIQLVKDDEVICELPLKPEEWEPQALERELRQIELNVVRMQRIHRILSNETRIRMLCEMARGSRRRFSELMEEVDANQKVISESLRGMLENDLIEKVQDRPRVLYYALSPLGFASFLSSIAMCRIMDEIKRMGGEL